LKKNNFLVFLFALLLAVGSFASVRAIFSPITEYEYPDIDCEQISKSIEDYNGSMKLFNTELLLNLKELSLWQLKVSEHLALSLAKPHVGVKADIAQLSAVSDEINAALEVISINSPDLKSYMLEDIVETCALDINPELNYDYVEAISELFKRIHSDAGAVLKSSQKLIQKNIKAWSKYKDCESSQCPKLKADLLLSLQGENEQIQGIIACHSGLYYKGQSDFCTWTVENLSISSAHCTLLKKPDTEKSCLKKRGEQ